MGEVIAEHRLPSQAPADPRDAEISRLREELNLMASAFAESLEHDRSIVADGVTDATKAINSRHWLTEGRGSYAWNDDRWHGEFRSAAVEILKAIEPLAKFASDWKGCPGSAMEIARARVDTQLEIARLCEKLAQAQELNRRWNRAFSRWACGSEFHDDPERVAGRMDEACSNKVELVRERNEMRHERDAAVAEKHEARSLLASATDLLNSWARESYVDEARDERSIKSVINSLWDYTSNKIHAEPTAWVEAAREVVKARLLKPNSSVWRAVNQLVNAAPESWRK